MRERKTMSNDGIVVIIANIDTSKKKLVGDVNITTRGFVQIQDNIELLKQIEKVSQKLITINLLKNNNINELKTLIINELSEYIYDKTGRNPVILPIVTNIN